MKISDEYHLVGYNNYVSSLRLYKTDKVKNLVVLDLIIVQVYINFGIKKEGSVHFNARK